jgi:hypothetical protein
MSSQARWWELISALYPATKTDVDGKPFTIEATSSPQIAAILELIEQLPSELIAMKPEQHIEYICSIAALREVLEKWRNMGNFVYDRMPGLRKLNPLTLVSQALATCPDEIPSSSTSELSFVTDDDLRSALRLDISATNSALVNREWKAATVLAGSVVEALLLWATKKSAKKEIEAAVKRLLEREELKKNPGMVAENWSLFQLRVIAAELQLIKERTFRQVELAQNFRNLIHPGRTQRLGEVCNRGTAMAAIAALEFVVEDLSP